MNFQGDTGWCKKFVSICQAVAAIDIKGRKLFDPLNNQWRPQDWALSQKNWIIFPSMEIKESYDAGDNELGLASYWADQKICDIFSIEPYAAQAKQFLRHPIFWEGIQRKGCRLIVFLYDFIRKIAQFFQLSNWNWIKASFAIRLQFVFTIFTINSKSTIITILILLQFWLFKDWTS